MHNGAVTMRGVGFVYPLLCRALAFCCLGRRKKAANIHFFLRAGHLFSAAQFSRVQPFVQILLKKMFQMQWAGATEVPAKK